MSEQLMPAVIVAPGEVLKTELEARGWTQKDLATIMGRPEQTVSEIINGKKKVTPETALEMGAALGTPAEFWNNLEANYQLDLARARADDETIARRRRPFEVLPLRRMIRRGWLCVPEDPDGIPQAVARYLGLPSLEATPALPATFRHSTVREPNTFALLAWIRRVEELAGQQVVAAFDRDGLRRGIAGLLGYAGRAEDVAAVRSFLARFGARFVIVPHLDKTYVDGAALYLDESPVIALSLRYDRIDAFWFTLLHEIAHILEPRKQAYIDSLRLESMDHEDAEPGVPCPSEAEGAADARARDWLFDPDLYAEYVESCGGRFSRSGIERFAASHGRHPGLLLGRLQHDGFVDYKVLRGLLVKVAPYLKDAIDT